MNNLNISQTTNSDVDIRDFILIIWNKKVMIIGFTLIAALIAGLISVFLLPTVYETKLNIVINMPDKYTTRYGDYELPITTNKQYIDLITSNDVITNTIKGMGYTSNGRMIDKLSHSISIGSVVDTVNNKTEQNSFEITVSAETPEKSMKLAQTLFDNYKEFLDVMIKNRVATNFYNVFTENIDTIETSLNSSKVLLENNKELLARTPQTINQKAAMNAIQGQFDNTKDFIVMENIINPNYTKVEEDIIKSEQDINAYEDKLNVYKRYLEELEKEKEAIEQYYKTSDKIKLKSNLTSIVESSIYLPSLPVAPIHKASPSNVSNTAMGAVFGCMIGIITVLVKKYWST